PKDESVFMLYYELLVGGLAHEVKSGRVELPRWLAIVKDSDEGPDALAIPELERRLTSACTEYFHTDVKVESIVPLDSRDSTLLQLADLFSGSIARVMNAPDGGDHAKDRFARCMET